MEGRRRARGPFDDRRLFPFRPAGGRATRNPALDGVLALLKSGELRSIDVSLRPGGRAHWRISASDLDQFILRRTHRPAPLADVGGSRPNSSLIFSMPTANGKPHNGQPHSPGEDMATGTQKRFTEEQLRPGDVLVAGKIVTREEIDAHWDAAAAQAGADAKQSPKPANKIIKIIPVVPPTLGEDAYLGLTGEFLRAVASHTEATDAGVLAHFLPVVGTVSGPYRHIWAGNKQPPESTRFSWVARTEAARGPRCAPVDLFMERVDAAFWSEQRGGGLSSGEGLINAVSDKRDAEGNIVEVEKRLYIPEEEFSRVLAQFHRDGNTLSQVIRQAYDNGNLATMTVNPRRAYGAHISIVGHITPEELKEKLGGVEMANGLGNRFLWFLVDSEKIISRPKPIPDSVLDFEPRLRTLLMIGAEKKECQVGLDKEAQEHWETLYSALPRIGPVLPVQ